jgi:hypothetical protein
MKKIHFLVATLFLAVLPMMFTSCNNPDDVTLVGKWEVVDAMYSYYFTGEKGDPIETQSFEVGQVWEFTKGGQLTVSGVADAYSYVLSNNVLTTEYVTAHYHSEAKFFMVDDHTADQLILSVHYRETDKVGTRDITRTLTFDRVKE